MPKPIKRPKFDVLSLSADKRRRILAANPHIRPEALGFLPEPGEESPAKAPSKSRARKAWRGTISFDSETEANVYDRLLAEHVTVIAHGKIALGESRHLEPDFIIVHEKLPDGRFIGELADAKGAWKKKTKHGTTSKVHAEKDWLVKADWLRETIGLIIRILTK